MPNQSLASLDLATVITQGCPLLGTFDYVFESTLIEQLVDELLTLGKQLHIIFVSVLMVDLIFRYLLLEHDILYFGVLLPLCLLLLLYQLAFRPTKSIC